MTMACLLGKGHGKKGIYETSLAVFRRYPDISLDSITWIRSFQGLVGDGTKPCFQQLVHKGGGNLVQAAHAFLHSDISVVHSAVQCSMG